MENSLTAPVNPFDSNAGLGFVEKDPLSSVWNKNSMRGTTLDTLHNANTISSGFELSLHSSVQSLRDSDVMLSAGLGDDQSLGTLASDSVEDELLGIEADAVTLAGSLTETITVMITAEARGSQTPPTAVLPDTLTNGDFLISADIAPTVGDGLDEITTWAFDFTQDPNLAPFLNAESLSSAILTLELTPTTTGIDTDTPGIAGEGLPYIISPEVTTLPLFQASTVNINLLDTYSSDQILDALKTGELGKIPMYYGDDALVSFAKIELTGNVPPIYDSGVFTVGESGQVTTDFLFDGSPFQGELAMFSLEGMERLEPGSPDFIREAAQRALSNSELGHIVIKDPTEGARFSGALGQEEQDWNAGEYLGVKPFAMTPGDRFGFMLVPNGSVQEALANPGISDSKKPLFSMSTTDPNDSLDGKQFVDVSGDRSAFAWEDWVGAESDRDYNDVVFQISGATGGASVIDELIDPTKDWRNSQVGQELVQSVVDPLDLAGNSSDQALRALPSTSGKVYRGWVGSLDPDDFYSFSLGMSNEFSLSLDGLSANANVEVLDFDGNTVFSSTNSEKDLEAITGILEHGAYRVRVFSKENLGTPYNLRLLVKPTVEGITTTGSEALFDIDIDESSRLINMDDFRSGNPAQGWHSEFLGVDGSGFSTVIIDTGIEADHPFFGPDTNLDGVADRITEQHDYANNDREAEDNSGHGTNVSSIAASQDPIFTGMAPGANIIHLKVMDNNSDDSTDKLFGRIEQALQWVVRNAETLNIVSVNMSLSDRTVDTDGDGTFDSNGNFSTPNAIQEVQARFGIADELENLVENNIIVVSTSGNHFISNGGVQGVGYPSADPNSLSVGSVWDGGDWWNTNGTHNNIADDFVDTSVADVIADSSQRHPTLTDIFAPGQMIVGAGNDGNPRLRVNNTNVQAFDDGTLELGGTSMAAPQIAGMAVLAQQLAERSLGRRLTPDEFRQFLYDTGTPINDPVTGVTTFRRADMLALADAIAPEILGDTRTVLIDIPSIPEFRPEHVGGEGAGDKEFEGHGPEFRIETRLEHNSLTLWTEVNAFFKETRSDWTEFRGTTGRTLVLNVEEAFPGWMIDSVTTPNFAPLTGLDILTDIDQDHEVNFYPGTTPLVYRYQIQGDTKQAGPFRDDDDPWVTVEFNPVLVTLRRQDSSQA